MPATTRSRRAHASRVTSLPSPASPSPSPSGAADASCEQDTSLPSPSTIPSEPTDAITRSYTYRSPIPAACATRGVRCVLGVDEAGRGPVLGPLVYAIAYCPIDFQQELKAIGFADSKSLTASKRLRLLECLRTNAMLGWATHVVAPQAISSSMLHRRPVNLNVQSTLATVHLISSVLSAGVDVAEIYVDTVGDPTSYRRLLMSYFPKHGHITWTVKSKADVLYPVVGAASIAAKVTRDRCLDCWKYAEKRLDLQEEMGSGYPGDPITVKWLKDSLDPVFGWPGVVRFSWATVKTLLDQHAGAPSSNAKRKSTTHPPSTSTSVEEGAQAKNRYGTLLPPSGKRAYTVTWNDQPTTIATFFKARPKIHKEAQEKALEMWRTEQRERFGQASKGWEAVGKLQRELGVVPSGYGWMQS
ncbi:hypothetical protein ACQY0O_002061 [Thecaphora frezii]